LQVVVVRVFSVLAVPQLLLEQQIIGVCRAVLQEFQVQSTAVLVQVAVLLSQALFQAMAVMEFQAVVVGHQVQQAEQLLLEMVVRV
jgi:hypothetical protein